MFFLGSAIFLNRGFGACDFGSREVEFLPCHCNSLPPEGISTNIENSDNECATPR
jgi:hypothetical protein